jgi:hypothetical protein
MKVRLHNLPHLFQQMRTLALPWRVPCTVREPAAGLAVRKSATNCLCAKTWAPGGATGLAAQQSKRLQGSTEGVTATLLSQKQHHSGEKDRC